jgi:L-lysine 6-transaminase
MVKFAVEPQSIHPILREHILADGFHVAIDLQRSHGSWIHDAVTDREILDFYSYFASLPVGHNHPRLTGDPEFMSALTRAAIANPANSDIYTSEYAAFVKTFAELAKPGDFKYLFFVAGGALAVENALKVAFDWKTRRDGPRRAAENDLKVVHFREAFHGRSGYTMSLTNTDPLKISAFPKFDWPRVVNPKLTFPITAAVEARTAELERRAVAEIEDAFAKHPGEIAAIIIEPIQGEGGDNHFRAEFFRALRRLADGHGALLIFDEIQTGFGITGKMWAYEHFGVAPDICVFGKKAQVCGIMVTDRIDDASGHVFQVPGRINSTWGGNLVDMVRCVKYLEIIHDERLVENAGEMGRRFLAGLVALASRHEFISNVRGRGLLTAFTLPSPDARDALRRKCWERGLATLPSWPTSVRFRPCLNVRPDEIDRALGILDEALREIRRPAASRGENDGGPPPAAARVREPIGG